MDRIVKRFFHKGKVIQDDDAKSFNQGQTASEENQTGFKDDYGIKVLCSPDQPRADVIFVHGLTGSQLSTWTAPGAPAPWPSSLLSDDIPDARISAFGYDADVVNFLKPAGQNNIRHHARNLLRGIADMWLETGVDGLPILFVAHSLGGLVCEKALIVANNAEQYERRVLECTKAMAFLGTPHRGSDLASWATITGNMVKVATPSNMNILELLNPDSEVLENLTQVFYTMLRSREQTQNSTILINCFIEELPVSKFGKSFMVVPSKSATLEQYPYVTIHADHIGMTKFKVKNNDYKRIAVQLKRWMKELALPETMLGKAPGPAMPVSNTDVLLGTNVPKKSVSYFVKRVDILIELDKCLSSKSETTSVVLLGMGGSGKTQLALEICRRAEAESNFTAIFWIDASSPATVTQSYNTIARKVAGRSQSIADVEDSMAIVEGILQGQKGKWLAVLDNFDNPEIFQEHNIQYYVPRASHASVLFTSRHESSERLGHVIRVSGMTKDESLDMLLQRPISHINERAQGLAIAAMLGYLALALDQAGAYIREQHLPLQDFESHYKRRKKKILEGVPAQWEYRKKLGKAEKETSLSVFITWELSFELISGSEEVRDRKEHFLMLAACFDNKCISQRYFEAFCQKQCGEWMNLFKTDAEWNNDEYGDVVAECTKLSLLQSFHRRADGVQFSLHPVVRDWLKLRKELQAQLMYQLKYSCILARYIEGVAFDELNLQVKQETLLHIDACMQGDWEAAIELYGVSESVSYCQSLFASCYQSDGQYSKTIKICKRALVDTEKKREPDHPDTLIAVRNLATLYCDTRRRKDAANLFKRALAGFEKIMGPDHPDTLQTMQQLAGTYNYEGPQDEAKELITRVLSYREKHLGPDHLDTLAAASQLSMIYGNEEQYDEATELCKRVISGREKILGPDHLDTLAALSSLATIYVHERRYNDVEELSKYILVVREEKLGPNHPDTLTTVKGLALLLQCQGRHNEVISLLAKFGCTSIDSDDSDSSSSGSL